MKLQEQTRFIGELAAEKRRELVHTNRVNSEKPGTVSDGQVERLKFEIDGLVEVRSTLAQFREIAKTVEGFLNLQ